MTMTELYTRVPTPTVAPRPYGLFSVVTPTSPPDEHWEVGVTWQSVTCIDVNVWTDLCITGEAPPAEKAVSNCADAALAQFKPITAYVALGRSQVAAADIDAMAAGALNLGEESAVEAGLWALMASAAGVPLTGGNAIEALAQVEQALAENYHGLGVIHITPGDATRLGPGHLTGSGSKLTTTLGTPVVVGAGYDDGDDLIIGSGVLNAFRSTTETYSGVNQAVNDRITIVERTYVVGWDCFVTAAALT